MKKSRLLGIILLAVITMFLTVACGDDEKTEIVDGVNVKKGKKLTEVIINDEELYGYNMILNIKYDDKGRMTKVVWTNHGIMQFAQGERNYTLVDVEPVDVISIDYKLREIQLNYKLLWSVSDDLSVYSTGSRSLSRNYMFLLNKKGYISQIADCSCEYDEDGYLTSANSTKQILNITRSEGEIIRSIIEWIVASNLNTSYFYYGEDSDMGELHFTINCPEYERKSHDPYDYSQAMIITSAIIAYQSGLFGETDIHTKSMAESAKTKAVINIISKKSDFKLHCDLRYE